MGRKGHGVFARDLGGVDLEDEQNSPTVPAREPKPAQGAAADKEPGPKMTVDAAKDEAQKGKAAGKDSRDREPADRSRGPESTDRQARASEHEAGWAKARRIVDQERKEQKAQEAQKDREALEAEEEEVSIDEVRDVEAEEVGQLLPVKKRGRGRMLVVAVVAVLVLIPLLYFVVIPRTELTLKIYYNESLLNQINVDAELRNGGTVSVDDVALEISVVNSTDQEQAGHNYTPSSIAPHATYRGEAMTFRGSQYEDYTILIDLRFSAGGRSYSEHWSHETKEPWMNQEFTEMVSGF